MAEPVVKAVPLKIATVPGAGESTQPADDDPWTPKGAVTPPLDLDSLAGLTKVAPLRRSCIAAIAQNTVGLGFELRPVEGHEDDVSDDDITEATELLDQFARRDRRLNRPSLTRLLEAAKWDEQEVGNGYLEASRNKVSGEVDGLYHIVGKRLRRKLDENGEPDGWILGPRDAVQGTTTSYYDFGDKVQYDDEGRPTGTLAGRGRKWAINEIIPFQLYTSESRDYGLPPDAQLATDYLGDHLASQTNVGFFDSGGVPPKLIFVKGVSKESGDEIIVEVGPDFTRQIADLLKGGKSRNGKVALVPVPAGVDTEEHDLGVISDRDVGFVSYRADNRRRTLGAFRLSPIFVSDIEDAGKYTAEVERAISKEQVFDPEQARWQDILFQSVLSEINPHLTIEFTDIDIVTGDEKRQTANDGGDRSVLTNGEWRKLNDLPPLPEAEEGDDPIDYEPGQVDPGWNAALMGESTTPEETPPPEEVPPPEDVTDVPDVTDVEKSDAELAEAMQAEFEVEIEDAIRRTAEAGGVEPDSIKAITVEKNDEGSVVISPVGVADAAHNGSR